MSDDRAVTTWIEKLKNGNAQAAQKIWEESFARLVRLAKKKLTGVPLRSFDGEDVALSAFRCFFEGVKKARFPQLADRNNLWALLVVITARKAISYRQRHARLKHGGGKVHGESAFGLPGCEASEIVGIGQVVGKEPVPEFTAQIAEELKRLFALLQDAGLQEIARMKLEGFTNKEIAKKGDCACGTIERKLRLIRKIWKEEREPKTDLA